MIEVKNALEQKLQIYEKVADSIETKVQRWPKGHLRLCKPRNGYNHGEYKFYYMDEDGNARKMIRKKDLPFAKRLAQRDYEKKMYSLAKKRVGQIKRLLKDFEDDELEQVYEKLCKGRKDLVVPTVFTKEEMLEQWRSHLSTAVHPIPISGNVKTNRGEKVRSKSEKILADLFEQYGIPYKYENAVYYSNHYSLYPDFTLFNVRTQKTYYWEHWGTMEDENYFEKQVDKLNKYAEIGITLEDNLIVTMETNRTMTDMKLIKDKIEKKLL